MYSRKLFGVVGALLALMVLIMACASTGGSTSASTSGEQTIVCLGDSLTAGGYQASNGRWLEDRSKSYPAFLQNKVTIPVINAGVGGTTADGLAHVKKDVLSKNPRIVIIELGINDNIQKVPLATTKNNLQKIIDMVNDGSRKIYLVKFPNWIPQYVDMFNSLASSNNIELIDGILDGLQEIHYSADGRHPNAAGYELMAENYFNALKPYLEANNLLR